jgi:hypothetical protein
MGFNDFPATVVPSVSQPESATAAASAADASNARTRGLRFKRKLPDIRLATPSLTNR